MGINTQIKEISQTRLQYQIASCPDKVNCNIHETLAFNDVSRHRDNANHFFVEYKLINKVELFNVCNNILYDNKNNTTNLNFNIYICSRYSD